ncbi:flagellar assembly protein FliW [Arthrobacter sp. GMC3]|uniref:flagellar assembly protein FliW n=1 Tax=Arthrobacter sp. GMC3 TaxID=2058894 RepID=UPI000CE54163|nr:flagellar assembly protein FliW [Arthrobacter sp. GMC3]
MSVEALIAELRFVTPPPGLEPKVNFTLAAIENAVGLFSLTANDGTARLYVLDAATHLPDYSPRLPAAELSAIGTDVSGVTVLVVVNPGVQSTVNLAAPILLNSQDGSCTQVILEGGDWPLRAPLTPA